MNLCQKCRDVLKNSRLWDFSLTRLSRQFRSVHAKQSTESANAWQPVIGLEIHAQMNTESKLFSRAKNQFMAPPNSLVSEFDAAIPGTLPVLNKSCVEAAVKTSIALGCQINQKSYFDRKHYFYNDLPQGYQITQYWKPIAENGFLSIPTTHGSGDGEIYWKTVRIERIQIEQDSGKSLHDDKERVSLIDLNRAGVGLMEIVTAPDFRSAEEAATFVLDLQLTLKKLGTCKGKIAEGNLRVDANVSLHIPGEPYGIRSEVKNIAGISGLVDAINFEIARHKSILNRGGKIVNETREYNSEKGITISMRDKEEFQDYRFMSEPNLPPLILYTDEDLPDSFDSDKQINIDEIRRKFEDIRPPSELRKGLLNIANLNIQESSFLLENNVAEYLLDVLKTETNLPYDLVSHWIKIELLGLLNNLNIPADQSPVTPAQMGELLTLCCQNEIDHSSAVEIFNILAEEGGSPRQIMEKRGWRLISDVSEIEAYCVEAIEQQDHSKLFNKYRRGEHTRPKNKKAVKLIVDIVLERTERRAHTKLTQSAARDLLDQYFVRYQTGRYNTN